jgi:hypothetical protein
MSTEEDTFDFAEVKSSMILTQGGKTFVIAVVSDNLTPKRKRKDLIKKVDKAIEYRIQRKRRKLNDDDDSNSKEYGEIKNEMDKLLDNMVCIPKKLHVDVSDFSPSDSYSTMIEKMKIFDDRIGRNKQEVDQLNCIRLALAYNSKKWTSVRSFINTVNNDREDTVAKVNSNQLSAGLIIIELNRWLFTNSEMADYKVMAMIKDYVQSDLRALSVRYENLSDEQKNQMKRELYEKIYEAKVSISKMGLKLLEANDAYDRAMHTEVVQE